MTGILQRYRIILIVISLVLLGILAWVVLSKQNVNKIPSRGVFVCDFKQKTLNYV